ncbi:MAG: RHS repeat-associated core domain-containing protein [Myxococcales bacterium]
MDTHVGNYFYADGAERVLEERDGSVTYYVARNFEVRDGVAVTYARAGDRRLARVSQSALQTSLFADPAPSAMPKGRIDVGDAWLMNKVSRGGARHLYASARRLLLEHSSSRVFLHHDHLGNAVLATEQDARARGECAYETMGEPRQCRGVVDAYAFTGQRRDLVTHLVHFRQRELDARSWRWVSPDPLFLRAGDACMARPFECANGYQYVLNDPVDAVDPTGQIMMLFRFSHGDFGLAISAPGRRFGMVHFFRGDQHVMLDLISEQQIKLYSLAGIQPTVLRSTDAAGEQSAISEMSVEGRGSFMQRLARALLHQYWIQRLEGTLPVSVVEASPVLLIALAQELASLDEATRDVMGQVLNHLSLDD